MGGGEHPSVPALEKESVVFTGIELAARRLLSSESDQGLEVAYLSAQLASGDVSGAYWFSRAVESSGRDAGFPSWLLAALATVETFEGLGPSIENGLREIVEANPIPELASAQLVAWAVALVPSVQSPQSGLLNWLTPPALPSFLRPLTEAVRGFAELNLPLPPDANVMLASEEQRRAQIQHASNGVRHWAAEAAMASTSFGPATMLWRSLLKNGPLARLVETAVSDKRSARVAMSEFLKLLNDHGQVGRLLTDRSQKGKKIVGKADTWLRAHVAEGVEHYNRWAQLAELEDQFSERGDWVKQQLQSLRAAVEKMALQASLDLVFLAQTNGALQRAAAHAASRAVSKLALLVGVVLDRSGQNPRVLSQLRLASSKPSIRRALATRLLMLPAFRLAPGNGPWTELKDLSRLLPEETLRPLGVEESLRAWWTEKDFRFANDLLELVESDEQRTALEEQGLAKLEDARRQLAREILTATAEIERAYFDGVGPEDRSALTGALTALQQPNDLDLRGAFLAVEGVRKQLKAIRTTHINQMQEEWAREKRQIAAAVWTPDQKELARRRVDQAFSREDYRSVGELVSKLRDALENVREFDPALFGEAPVRSATLEG